MTGAIEPVGAARAAAARRARRRAVESARFATLARAPSPTQRRAAGGFATPRRPLGCRRDDGRPKRRSGERQTGGAMTRVTVVRSGGPAQWLASAARIAGGRGPASCSCSLSLVAAALVATSHRTAARRAAGVALAGVALAGVALTGGAAQEAQSTPGRPRAEPPKPRRSGRGRPLRRASCRWWSSPTPGPGRSTRCCAPPATASTSRSTSSKTTRPTAILAADARARRARARPSRRPLRGPLQRAGLLLPARPRCGRALGAVAVRRHPRKGDRRRRQTCGHHDHEPDRALLRVLARVHRARPQPGRRGGRRSDLRQRLGRRRLAAVFTRRPRLEPRARKTHWSP